MIERGKRSASIETLDAIAEALGSTLEELFQSEQMSSGDSPAFQRLGAFLRSKRVGAAGVAQLLAVAKAMFKD
jgi:transcriptional regulator with XRE-family HTH domain